MVQGEKTIMYKTADILNMIKIYVNKYPHIIAGVVFVLFVITVSAAANHDNSINQVFTKDITFVDPGNSKNIITFYPEKRETIDGTFKMLQQSGQTIGGTYIETQREYQVTATETGEGKNFYKTKDGGINIPIRNTGKFETWYPKSN